MARPQNTGRRCSFESLEDRRLLAGDVTAKIVRGNLLIQGDNLANGITITAGANASEVVVTGVNAGGSATNVNGTGNAAVTLSGFNGDLKIKMKRGDDNVAITNITTTGKVKIDGGYGNDTFDISESTFGGTLTTKLGRGDDTLSLNSTAVSGKTKVLGYKGDDVATITDSMFSKLAVTLGKGDDLLTVSGTTVSSRTNFNGQHGTNTYTDGGGNSLANRTIRHFDQTSSTSLNQATLNPLANISEGGAATLTGTFSDSDTSSSHTLTADWGDPDSNADSTFAIPATVSLTTGQTINSSTDSAVLTISSVSAGQVGYSVQHRYRDDGVAPGNATNSDTSTITVTVTDGGTFNASKTTTVTVDNVGPSVALDSPSNVAEHGVVTLTGRYTDAGLLDAQTLAINWGDSNNSAASTFAIPAIQNAGGTATLSIGQTLNSSTDSAILTITSIDITSGQVGFSVQHQYLDDGTAVGNSTASDASTISASITDDDSVSGLTTTAVTINNVAPTLSLNAVAGVAVNGTATLTGTYTDIGLLDQHPLLVQWGDNSSSQFVLSAIRNPAGAATLSENQTFNSTVGSATLTITSVDASTGQVGFSVAHQYTAAGANIQISATLLDDDTGTASASTTVTVSVIAPAVTLNSVPAINEAGTATLTGSFTDAILTDTHDLTVNWSDPNNGNESTFAIPATNGLIGDQTINSSTDNAVLTITSVNTATGQVGFSVQHQYVDDGDSSIRNYTPSDNSSVLVFVTGATAGSKTGTATVTVNNVAPTLVVNPISDISVNTTVTLSGTYTDIGLADLHFLAVDWDDPNSVDNPAFTISRTSLLSVNQTFNSTTGDAVLKITSVNSTTGQVGFEVQHKYTTTSNPTIDVAIADDDVGSSSATVSFVVGSA